MPDLDVENVEAGQGGNNEASSPSEEVVGLRKALQASRQSTSSMKVEMAEMKGKLEGLAVKTEPVREFTRAELQAQVDDGRMTPDDSDRILSEQSERKITEQVTQRIESAAQTKTYATKIQAELNRYTKARPDILVAGSDDWQLISAEFDRQKNDLGKPDTVETELSSCMAVFGPSNRLQNGKDKELQTHQETGSDGGTGEGQTANSWPKDMPAKNRNYYDHLINTGVLADRAAAVEEWNYKPKNR